MILQMMGTYGNRMIFDDHNHNLFNVYSILDYCVVKAGAKQVMGFITCRRLKIEKRSKPLNDWNLHRRSNWNSTQVR